MTKAVSPGVWVIEADVNEQWHNILWRIWIPKFDEIAYIKTWDGMTWNEIEEYVWSHWDQEDEIRRCDIFVSKLTT